MSFTLCLTHTANGREETTRLPDQLEKQRAETEEMIERFRAGGFPAEGTFSIRNGNTGELRRSWRWCDVKDIWIEED